jgi:hypothetical protein
LQGAFAGTPTQTDRQQQRHFRILHRFLAPPTLRADLEGHLKTMRNIVVGKAKPIFIEELDLNWPKQGEF